MKPLLVSVTTENVEQARRIAQVLVEERLAACVQVVPQIHSVYRWKGKAEEAGESLLLIKSSQELWESLQKRIRELHSYECPEVVALPVYAAEASYLNWWSHCLESSQG
ncbi:divalent-cation tolerance protein CutA [Candidatus Methylacidithermus pantelleriae]|uniref:Divalent-cation tolerance protein CutA n=1 Tax=Candidatus Methylacidithermus pantelleriae TaxID=2744239 RepID=A0A8J2BS65_9BACT|nr:divalent-cation tolerance protein CutA [Candidatus Methylacidithermus pantelleriae]CAF0703579.1 Divalent-cation tolerance protein CutA [Candidatus Methylacidithermus pantelleriae]